MTEDPIARRNAVRRAASQKAWRTRKQMALARARRETHPNPSEEIPMAEIAGIDRLALRRYVDRVVALHEERKSLNGDIASVYDEAKEAGIVTKHLRTVVREAMMDREEREAQYHMLASYRSALGMLADTPLGEAAMSAAETTAEDDGGGEGAVRTLRRGPGRPRKVPEAEIGEPLGAA